MSQPPAGLFGAVDMNQGYAYVEPKSPEEARLAEQFMVIAARAKGADGKLRPSPLPAPIAILCARYALESRNG